MLMRLTSVRGASKSLQVEQLQIYGYFVDPAEAHRMTESVDHIPFEKTAIHIPVAEVLGNQELLVAQSQLRNRDCLVALYNLQIASSLDNYTTIVRDGVLTSACRKAPDY
jgi:hypothetical protein